MWAGWKGIFSVSSVSVGLTGPSQILAYGSICDPSPNRLWSAFDLKSQLRQYLRRLVCGLHRRKIALLKYIDKVFPQNCQYQYPDILCNFFSAAPENGHCSTDSAVSPSVAKTPQKSQSRKILDKVKKEQQLKGKHFFPDFKVH